MLPQINDAMPTLDRLLVTGAAGQLGTMLREKLPPLIGDLAASIRWSDLVEVEEGGANEECVVCDLADADAVRDLVAGCDGIVHLGGVSVERPWAEILPANIVGVHNLYEAVRKTDPTTRIVFASSNHAIGYYEQTQTLDASVPQKPDGFYGVSKCFGEAMASFYHSKFGIETASLRIGSCTPEPLDHRMLATWLSEDDFVRFIQAVMRAPRLGCPVVYGASNNDRSWWSNRLTRHIGWVPEDNAEDFAAKVEQQERPDRDAAVSRYQGGKFTDYPIYE